MKVKLVGITNPVDIADTASELVAYCASKLLENVNE
jgi:hypothetical protein